MSQKQAQDKWCEKCEVKMTYVFCGEDRFTNGDGVTESKTVKDYQCPVCNKVYRFKTNSITKGGK